MHLDISTIIFTLNLFGISNTSEKLNYCNYAFNILAHKNLTRKSMIDETKRFKKMIRQGKRFI